MQTHNRAAGILLMLLTMIVLGILLAVSICFINNYYHYGDIFRRERGLSIFNLIISLFGLIICVLGLFTKIGNRATLGKIAATGCSLLGLCAFISLLAAIALNLMTVDHVSSSFVDTMHHYKDSADARYIVDSVQKHYSCCGNNVWLDWATVQLNPDTSDLNGLQTSVAPQTATTSMGGLIFTKSSARTGSTTKSSLGITTSTNWKTTKSSARTTTTTPTTDYDDYTDVQNIVDSNSGIQAGSNQLTTSTARSWWNFQTTSKLTNTLNNFNTLNFGSSNRRKRSSRDKRSKPLTSVKNYGLPLSYAVVLPQSCCINDVPTKFNSFDSYCVSNANTMLSSYHGEGCSKYLVKDANRQALSIAIINSFLVLLALAAVPMLKKTYSGYVYPLKPYRNSSLQMPQVQKNYR